MAGQELWQILLGMQSGINLRYLTMSCEESLSQFVRDVLA